MNMGSKLDVTADVLLQRLTWDWQPLEPIVEELIPTVAPGVAMRRYEKRSQRSRSRSRSAAPTSRLLTDRQQQESGARSIIHDRIASQRNAGRIEVLVIDGVRCVRLNDRRRVAEGDGACPTCKRPFAPATAGHKPQPASHKSRQQKVIYPKFPQWDNPPAREGSSG